MSESHPPWNSDCLNVIALLAMSQEGKKLRRLARRFGLFGTGAEPGPAELLRGLHEVCHRDPEFAKLIEKDLDGRFCSTVARVRSLPPEEVGKMEMHWPVPLLWATMTDSREEVRLHGRRLLHGVFWNTLRRPSAADGNGNTREAVKSLEEKIRTMAIENAGLQRDREKRETEILELRRQLRDANLRRETGRAAQGNGRGSRESRKLEHELRKERERVKALSQIMEAAGLFLPAGETAVCDPATCPCMHEQPDSRMDICDDCPLAGLRVAVVGGPGRMLPAYRKVVRDLGAEFLFHDGGVRNGSCRLKGIVDGADIVVFITSVNSHGALGVVKTACRKRGSRFIALRETGAESLVRTLKAAAA